MPRSQAALDRGEEVKFVRMFCEDHRVYFTISEPGAVHGHMACSTHSVWDR